MTLNEAAELLGVHPSTLRHQVRNGRLEASRHGRDWWVTEASVAAYRAASLGRPGRKRKEGSR